MLHAMKTLLIALLILTAGCSMRPRDKFRVEMDPAFSAEQQEDLLQAMQDWQTSVAPDPLILDVWIGDEYCSRSACNDVITIHPSDLETVEALGDNSNSEDLGVTIYNWHPNAFEGEVYWADIYLIPKADSTEHSTAVWNQETRHELGHAFGLNHTGPGSVMCKNAVCASEEISAEDVWQFRQVRK